MADVNASPVLSHYLTYAMPAIAMAWMQAPIVVVQGVYAKYLGISLTTIAAIVLLARIFDAVTDPLVGYFADRYHNNHGTRKPFVVVGGLLMMVSSYFLYVPYSSGAVYFGVCLFLFYLAYTIFEIPHQAWASELATTAANKSIIFSLRNMVIYFGLGLFYVIPLLPFFESQNITFETLEVSVSVACILMLVFLVVCVRYTPNGVVHPVSKNKHKQMTISKRGVSAFRSFIQLIIRNRPMCLFLGGYLSWGLGGGMWLGLLFLYVDSYLLVGELFAQAFLIGLLAGIVATPCWCNIAIKFGKKTAMGLAFVLMIISFIYTSMLKLGEVGLLELIVLNALYTIGTGCIQAIAPALLSEIIDYNTWKFRTESTAMYFAIQLFLNKAVMAIGAAIGLAIAGWYGFEASTTEQSTESAVGLLLAMTVFPVGFLAMALVLTVLNPINARRHNIISRRLSAGRVREHSVCTVTENKDQRKINLPLRRTVPTNSTARILST